MYIYITHAELAEWITVHVPKQMITESIMTMINVYVLSKSYLDSGTNPYISDVDFRGIDIRISVLQINTTKID